MTDNVKIVKKLYDACMNKDFDTVRELVHPNYTLKDPMMKANGVEELIAMMESCPSVGKMENVQLIAEGNKVVGTFDAINSQPKPWRLRMCSIMTLENGKVKSEEMFYDTAQIPAEARQEMKNIAQNRKKAA